MFMYFRHARLIALVRSLGTDKRIQKLGFLLIWVLCADGPVCGREVLAPVSI